MFILFYCYNGVRRGGLWSPRWQHNKVWKPKPNEFKPLATAVQKCTPLSTVKSFPKLSGRKQDTFFLPAEPSRQVPARQNDRKSLWDYLFCVILCLRLSFLLAGASRERLAGSKKVSYFLPESFGKPPYGGQA
jgi:hypothetical protein